jgi:septal ring factor EnvC (AmiA/AmiB activator)
MRHRMFRIHSIVLAVAVCTPTGALAQQAPAAPPKSKAQGPSIVIPASPAPKATTKTLGGKAVPGGKMLSRDELRACMKRLDDVNAAGKDLQSRRTALDAEREELLKSGEALKTMKADVETKLAAVRGWQERMRAHAAEIEAFNRKTKAIEEAPRNQREELSKALETDRDNLNKVRATLVDEEARFVPAYETSVRSYNERALARDAVVSDWNVRNKALNDAGTKVENDRTDWLNECANRPYREDDEIAIKAGK